MPKRRVPEGERVGGRYKPIRTTPAHPRTQDEADDAATRLEIWEARERRIRNHVDRFVADVFAEFDAHRKQ